MDRRHFLKRLLAAPAALSASRLLPACGDGPQGPTDLPATDHVLVIGAGMAGLAAASDLHARGIQVTVIEARDRLGGRVFTDRQTWPDQPVDLGASWIHGTRGNPLTDLAEAFGAQTVPTDYDSTTLYAADGTRLSEDEADEIWWLTEDVLEEALAYREERLWAEQPDISLGEAIDHVLEGWGLTQAERDQLTFGLTSIIDHEYAASPSELSLYHFDQGEFFGGDDVIFPQGYVQLIDGLAEGLTVELGAQVQKITWGEDGVRVATSRGEFTGDRVIVTLPLGVLKAGGVEFDPAVPAERAGAIERLGVGVLDKLYLRFDEAFWSRDGTQVLNYISDPPGRWAEDLNLEYYLDKPILLMFNAADVARDIEALSDEEIVAEAMAVLRTMYGPGVPDPTGWRLTRWAQDPYARGSYSYCASGATADDYDLLAAPLGERVFFAGEATIRAYTATVHGAYESGVREASRWLSAEERVAAGAPRAASRRKWIGRRAHHLSAVLKGR